MASDKRPLFLWTHQSTPRIYPCPAGYTQRYAILAQDWREKRPPAGYSRLGSTLGRAWHIAPRMHLLAMILGKPPMVPILFPSRSYYLATNSEGTR